MSSQREKFIRRKIYDKEMLKRQIIKELKELNFELQREIHSKKLVKKK